MAMLKFNGNNVKDPSSMTWSLERVSSPDAGRSLDGVMHVMQVSLKRKLQLSWNNITATEASAIVNAASGEYINVTFYDYLANATRTLTMYTGAHTIPVYTFQSNRKIVSNVSFDLIEV